MFLRQLGAAGLLGPAVSTLACGQPETGAGEEAPDPERLTRPVLFPWSDDTLRIGSTVDQRPLAYVSMGYRRVYVDRAARDRVHHLLGAHISVSTGHWRIPLLGDDPRQPITPGDTLREFEEQLAAEWTEDIEPALGDIRVVRGRPVPVIVDFSCVPLPGSAVEWCRGGPWTLVRCDGSGAEPCREDLMIVGSGARYAARDCAGNGEPLRYLAWASGS